MMIAVNQADYNVIKSTNFRYFRAQKTASAETDAVQWVIGFSTCGKPLGCCFFGRGLFFLAAPFLFGSSPRCRFFTALRVHRYRNVQRHLAVQLERTPGQIRHGAPEFGQHTEEVLLEFGFEWAEIEGLQSSGAIGQR